MVTSSRSPSENGSVISNESGKPSSGRRSPQNVTAQQKVTKEEARKRNGEQPSLPSTTPRPVPHMCGHRHAYTCTHPCALNLSSSFYCVLQSYLLGYRLSPFSELVCLVLSAPCSHGVVPGLRKALCRMNGCLLSNLSNS